MSACPMTEIFLWKTHVFYQIVVDFALPYRYHSQFCAAIHDRNISVKTHNLWTVIIHLVLTEITYEYERQEPAPRRGLAPPVLIFQTSPSCNFFTKNPNFFRNRCQPSHKGLFFWPIFGLNYPDFGEIHASPHTKGLHWKIIN